VLDFWATWCVPCLQSFSYMQIVLDKYKKDPNVQFLFIDTGEKVDNYQELVKKIMDDNHYTFHVALDEKGPEGKQNKVYGQYGTGFIPARFIVDGKGKVSLEEAGYRTGLSDEEQAKKFSKEIEKVKKA
jgi:thiol-disulfide isomerase/thioredoxin